MSKTKVSQLQQASNVNSQSYMLISQYISDDVFESQKVQFEDLADEVFKRNRNISTKTSNYEIAESDYTILVNAENESVTITLPASSAAGKTYLIKCINDDNLAQIDPNTNSIDGSFDNFHLILHEVINIQSDGTNWWII